MKRDRSLMTTSTDFASDAARANRMYAKSIADGETKEAPLRPGVPKAIESAPRKADRLPNGNKGMQLQAGIK